MMRFTTSPTRKTQNKKSHLSWGVTRWGAAFFWVLVWQLAAYVVGEPLLLPAPLAVGHRLVSLMLTETFWNTTLGSLGRISFGFLLGLSLGALLAVVTCRFPLARAVVALPMGVIKATPVASFVILALLFLRGNSFSVFISFLMVLPLAWSNIATGIEKTDPKLLEMAQVYRFTGFYRLRYIYLPSVRPYLLSAAQVGLGFAWKSGVAGEVIAAPQNAIGTQLYNAKIYLETTDLFAWTAVIILLSLLLERLATALVFAKRGDTV